MILATLIMPKKKLIHHQLGAMIADKAKLMQPSQKYDN